MAKHTRSSSRRVPSAYVLRFRVKPLGPARSEQTLREDVESAFAEAYAEVRPTPAIAGARAEATVEPEGPFLAGGLELWFLSVAVTGAKLAAGGAAAALGKKVVESVWDGFSKRLQKRNILVEQARATEATEITKPAKAAKTKAVKTTKTTKAAKAAKASTTVGGPKRPTRRGKRKTA